MNVMTIVLQAAPTGEGSALNGALANIPTDPASLFVYGLLVFCMGLIWKGSRKRPPSGPSLG